jgi:hypothetical protein
MSKRIGSYTPNVFIEDEECAEEELIQYPSEETEYDVME